MILVMVFSPTISMAGIFLFPGNKVVARIIGAQVMTLTLSAGCYLLEVYRGGGRPKLSYWKYAVLYNLPLIPYFLSSYVLSSSDRLMIGYFWGEDKAGIYGIAYTMSAVVNIVWNSINATLVPTIYQRCDDGRRRCLPVNYVTFTGNYPILSSVQLWRGHVHHSGNCRRCLLYVHFQHFLQYYLL